MLRETSEWNEDLGAPLVPRFQRSDLSSDDLLECDQLEQTSISQLSLPAIRYRSSTTKLEKNSNKAKVIDIKKQKIAKIPRKFCQFKSSDEIKQLRNNNT